MKDGLYQIENICFRQYNLGLSKISISDTMIVRIHKNIMTQIKLHMRG